MSLIQKYKNWKSAKNPAKISLKNAWRVIRAYLRMFFLKDYWVHEQAFYRHSQMNYECKKNSFCSQCGCDTKGLSYENSSCEKRCYPGWMNEKLWNSYKILKGINIPIEDVLNYKTN